MCTEPAAAHGAATLAGPPPEIWLDLEPPVEFDLEPVDAVSVTVLMDNIIDVQSPSAGPAHRPTAGDVPTRPVATMVGGGGPDALVAEHGFSVLVTVTKGDRRHTILFDTGTTPAGVVGNMRRLEVDPSAIEAIVCSHGHYDHTAGLDGLADALGPRNLPVLLHPHFWRRRRLTVPGREPREMPTTSRRALEDVGFEVVEDPHPSFLLDGAVLVTGEVARTTGYEPGMPSQQAWLDDGWTSDPVVLDDQALVVDVRDKGLVVITGCGHAGVVNICRWARRLTGERPVHAVIGGFHLNGPVFEPLVPRVLDDLAAIGPDYVVPGHCTGWRAQHALAGRFADAYVPCSVGTRLAF